MAEIPIWHICCTHKEPSGTKDQVVVSFRTSNKDFGATVIVRVDESQAEDFEIDRYYKLTLTKTSLERKHLELRRER